MAAFKFAKKLTKEKKVNNSSSNSNSNSNTNSNSAQGHLAQNGVNGSSSQHAANGANGFSAQAHFHTQNPPSVNKKLPVIPGQQGTEGQVHQQQQPLHHMTNPQSRVHPSPGQQRNVSGASTSLSQQQKEYTPWNRVKLANTPFPRYRHVASSHCSEDNRLYVIGGLHDQSVYGDTWIISTNESGTQFQSKTVEISETTPPPRVGHAATLCGNAFVLFGGDTHKVNSEGLMDDDLYLFNVNSYKWTIPHPVGQRPLGRYGHKISIIAANQMKTKLYLFGGQFDDTYFNDLAVFDLSSFRRPDSHWEFLKPTTFSPPPLTNHTMVSYGSSLWVFGGDTLQGLINQVFKYDVANNDWSIAETTGTAPPPIQEHAAVIYKHLMVIVGGKDENDNYLNSVYFLNLKTREWFKLPVFKAGIPQGRSGHSLTLLNNDKLLIMGGDKFDFARPGEYDMNSSNTDMGKGTLLYTLDLSRIEEMCPGVLKTTEKENFAFTPATPPINFQQQAKLSQFSQPTILTPYSHEDQQTPVADNKSTPLQPKPLTPSAAPNIAFDNNETREKFNQFSNKSQQHQSTFQQQSQQTSFPGSNHFIPQRHSPQYTPQNQPQGQPQHPYHQKGHTRQPSELKKPVSPIPELEPTTSNNKEDVPKIASMGAGLPSGSDAFSGTDELVSIDENYSSIPDRPTSSDGPASSEGSRVGGSRPDSMSGEIGIATVASSPSKGDVRFGNKDRSATAVSGENPYARKNGLSGPVEITKQDGSSGPAHAENNGTISDGTNQITKSFAVVDQSFTGSTNTLPIGYGGSNASNLVIANNADMNLSRISSKETINKEVIHRLRSQLEELRIITEDKALQASEHIKELELEVQRLRGDPSRDLSSADVIKLQSHCDVMESSRTLMEDRIRELENMVTAKFTDIDALNRIIKEQSDKLDGLEQEIPFREELQDLRMRYDNLLTENQSLKSHISDSESAFRQTVKQYSSQLSNFIGEWRQHNSLRETGEVDANGQPKLELVPGGAYYRKAVQKLQNRFDALLQSNEEVIESNHRLTLDHRELSDTLEVRQKELEEMKMNYQEVLNSATNSSKALEMSQSELDKYKQINKKLKNEVDELKYLQDAASANDSSTNLGAAGNYHYNMKINDLKAELYIFKQERDNLKDEVLQLKKKLLTMGEQ